MGAPSDALCPDGIASQRSFQARYMLMASCIACAQTCERLKHVATTSAPVYSHMFQLHLAKPRRVLQLNRFIILQS